MYNLDIVRPTYVCNWPIIDSAWALLLIPLGSLPGLGVSVVPDSTHSAEDL